MKLKQMWKRFWTLDVHNHAGFTLVELIIVIAILAILSTGAIAGYSVYVEQANIAADEALVAEIKNALQLAYYSDTGNFEQGTIILSVDATPDCGGSAVLEKALTDAYGEGWNALRLKYADWSATFRGSNYGDKQALNELLGTVEILTGALGSALADDGLAGLIGGTNFENYMKNEIESATNKEAARADAAVFYVADSIGKLNSDQVNQLMANVGDYTEMNNITESALASTATMYALAEGYARYCGTDVTDEDGKTPADILEDATDDISNLAEGGITDAAAAFNILNAAFQKMSSINDYKHADDYMENHMQNDMQAFSEAMKTVSASKNTVLDNNKNESGASLGLGDDNYFNSSYVTSLMTSYADGCIIIYAVEDSDGLMTFTSSIDK